MNASTASLALPSHSTALLVWGCSVEFISSAVFPLFFSFTSVVGPKCWTWCWFLSFPGLVWRWDWRTVFKDCVRSWFTVLRTNELQWTVFFFTAGWLQFSSSLSLVDLFIDFYLMWLCRWNAAARVQPGMECFLFTLSPRLCAARQRKHAQTLTNRLIFIRRMILGLNQVNSQSIKCYFCWEFRPTRLKLCCFI